MDDERSVAKRLKAVEGADAGALGLTPPPESAPPEAQEPVEEHVPPGSTYGDRVPAEPKPWFTSLAAESDQAGVANEHGDVQDRQFPNDDDEALEDDVGP
jgi:hypothetical protein